MSDRSWREILEPIIQRFRIAGFVGGDAWTRFDAKGSAAMARLLSEILERLERASELVDKAQAQTADAMRRAEGRGYWRGIRDAAILGGWICALIQIVPRIMF